MDSEIRLRLELASVAESVALVRSVIRSVARTAGLDRLLFDDLRTAVSEACNNAVLHAYERTPGPLIFSLAVRGDAIEAIVRDQGSGIRPGAGRNRGLGMGVALINSLADRAEFESSEIGTEVRMLFKRPLRFPEPLSEFSLETWGLRDPRSSGALRARSN
ncbi:MAG: ATP-binding protein [Acidobacteriota bacterium]|nr:ATP-binding protein [Acidobacteriota bacterium]